MQTLFERLGKLCFLLMWIPFIIVMIKGPFSVGQEINGMPEGLGIWIILTVGLMIGTFFFLIGGSIIGALSNRSILAKGQLVKAKILSVNDTGTRINDNPVLLFSLEVQSPDQGIFVTQVKKLVSMAQLSAYVAGTTIDAKYIPGTKKVAIV